MIRSPLRANRGTNGVPTQPSTYDLIFSFLDTILHEYYINDKSYTGVTRHT